MWDAALSSAKQPMAQRRQWLISSWGSSDNSRNRIFKEEGEDVMIYPFDASKVEDPFSDYLFTHP